MKMPQLFQGTENPLSREITPAVVLDLISGSLERGDQSLLEDESLEVDSWEIAEESRLRAMLDGYFTALERTAPSRPPAEWFREHCNRKQVMGQDYQDQPLPQSGRTWGDG